MQYFAAKMYGYNIANIDTIYLTIGVGSEPIYIARAPPVSR